MLRHNARLTTWMCALVQLIAIGLSIIGTLCAAVLAQYKFSARAAIIDGESKNIEMLIDQFRNLDGPVFSRRKVESSNKGEKEPQELTEEERVGGYQIPDFSNVPDEVLLTAVSPTV